MRQDAENYRYVQNQYISDNDFMSNSIYYERDEDNGRCYRLRDSENLRPEWDGALVKVRISKCEYEAALKHCLNAIEEHEAFLKRVRRVTA